MKKLKFNLQYFAGSLTVTVIKDNNSYWSAASASPASSLAKDDTVALTATPATGYEVDEIEVIAGGVTIESGESVTFKMGEANVVLFAKSKGSAVYKVVENCYTAVNGTVTKLTRNMILVKGANGAIVDVTCTGTSLASVSADIVAQLVKAGVLIKM